jgi:hypothetical protein
MSSSGNLSENTAIANNVETTVFTLENLAPGTYSLTYNISMKPQGPKATYHKAWCWIDNQEEKELIASNITLPQDWPTSKKVTVSVTSDGSPILIKALVNADDPVELLHKHGVIEKDMYGNDVTKQQGCFWNAA